MVAGIRWSEWTKDNRLARKEKTVSVNDQAEAAKWTAKMISRLLKKDNLHEIESANVWDN